MINLLPPENTWQEEIRMYPGKRDGDLARAMQPWTQLARMGYFGVLHDSLSVSPSAFPSTVHDSVGMQ